MSFPSSHPDFPPFADLSLNDSQRSWQTPQLQSKPDFPLQSYTAESNNPSRHLSGWSVPGWQSSLDFGSDMIPPYSNTVNLPPSWGTPYYPKATMESLFLPRLSLPDLSDCEFFESLSAFLQTYCLTSAAAPSSPTDTCSSVYSDVSSSSPPPSIHVICNIPVVAPRPLPYHSPTFLQFELPDADADLSHPPYTRGPPKRKREADDESDKLRDAKRPATSSGYNTTHHTARSIRQSRGTRASQRSLR